jgi:nicotinate phosphoribosyltransferase
LVAFETDSGEWQSVAKSSAQKTNPGGKKFASRTDLAEIIDIHEIAEGRNLSVSLVDKGQPEAQYLGPEGVRLAREHHQTAKAELPLEGLRLMRGDAALATTIR